jgi:lipoate-protein ligase A
MIVWLDGAHDPSENMRRDRALLAAAEAGAEPVLRLFGFEPFGVTLGASQAPERVLDLERCRRDGVPWAVRPTGGRAIFHAEEWTYALAAPIADPEWGGTQARAYDRMSALVVRSLRRLGVPAELARPARRGDPAPPEACFAATTRHEIEVGGAKLVGSAQRRTRRALLQQGSLLLGEGHLRLADYVRSGDPEQFRAALRRRAASAATWLGPAPALGCWADALVAELPTDTRHVEGTRGPFLLTLEKHGSYTAALTNLEAVTTNPREEAS